MNQTNARSYSYRKGNTVVVVKVAVFVKVVNKKRKSNNDVA